MTTYDEVQRHVSPDGTQAVAFAVDDHGLVRYSLLSWHEPDPENPFEVKAYWHPVRDSGVYENMQDALNDASQDIPWLGTALVKPPVHTE
jgi:hypothetical protein